MWQFKVLGNRGLHVTVHSAGHAEEGHLIYCSNVRVCFSDSVWLDALTFFWAALAFGLMGRALRFGVRCEGCVSMATVYIRGRVKLDP